MSESYNPVPGVVPEWPDTTALLSQRDLGINVPVNYVTVPGVSYSSACFPQLNFEDDNSADCLSNLLATGFRRFEIDLYWDQDREVWSFCPVSIPTSIQSDISSSTATSTLPSSTAKSILLQSSTATSNLPSSTLQALSTNAAASTTGELAARQAPTTASLSSSASGIEASSLGTAVPSVTILPNSTNEPETEIGPYTCTTTINLSTFTSLFLSYIQGTQTTLEADILYVIINIHAAANASTPTLPAPAPTTLPSGSNQLSSLFSGSLSTYLYTPSNLMSDRVNLNGSWYGYLVASRYRPASEYYNTTLSPQEILSTEDGWPTTGYIEFTKSKRLLLGWGNIDPQMANYNFSNDQATIFPKGYIQDNQTEVTASSNGRVTNGCFLQNSAAVLPDVNSSWAVGSTIPGFDYATSSSSDLTPTLNLTSNITACGISPVLNVTLLNSTAHDDYVPYQNYSYSTIWSWAPGEPKNYTTSDSSSLYRCAAASTLDYNSHWAVTDCSQKYYAACRMPNQPYNWTLTTYSISYSYATSACAPPYAFAAPRTALENTYLAATIRALRKDRDFDVDPIWVDFNSVNIQGCWTPGGINATCPYSEGVTAADSLKKKTVIIPTVAAIIVLFVMLITIWAKCAGNRKIRKRTRKRVGQNGFVYEGVPS